MAHDSCLIGLFFIDPIRVTTESPTLILILQVWHDFFEPLVVLEFRSRSVMTNVLLDNYI